jgi:hypothetical protein
VGRAIGLVIAFAVVVAAGVAAWFGVERFALADDQALPAVGEGLPTEPIDPTRASWRRFQLQYELADGTDDVQQFDLDADEVRSTRTSEGTDTMVTEIRGDVGFEGPPNAMEPLAADVVSDARRFIHNASGPFVLTDVAPPRSIPFTTVESDVATETPAGVVRVITLSVDVERFRKDDPAGVEAWRLDIVTDGDGPARRVVHVLEDGTVVKIVDPAATATWTLLAAPLDFVSPLGDTPAASATTVPTPVPTTVPPTVASTVPSTVPG